MVANSGSSEDAGSITWVALGAVDVLDDVLTGPGLLGHVPKADEAGSPLGDVAPCVVDIGDTGDTGGISMGSVSATDGLCAVKTGPEGVR